MTGTVRTIVVTVAGDSADVVTDRMWQWGVQAVSETSVGDGRVEITTSVGSNDDAVARALATLDPAWSVELRDVDDAIAQVAPEFLTPTWYAPGMVSVPASLMPFEPRPGDDPDPLVTVIDPGSAFGLGDHPTTRTSMALLAGIVRDARVADRSVTRLLDVGCGTGALAVLAAQLGVTDVRAIDVADAAVEATRRNMELNDVVEAVDVDTTPVCDVTGEFDVVMANILAPVLISMADDLKRLVGPGGSLVVSGILAARHDHVLEALAPLTPTRSLEHDGWISIVFERRGDTLSAVNDGEQDREPDDALDSLIHRGDLDGLIRMIDDRSSTHDWAGLLRVRDRSRRAVETGRQLWPAATLAEYRLALSADAASVATVLDESDGLSGRFTIGPLTEVAAQHHAWGDLAGLLDRGPRASLVAHERALRGEPVDATGLAPVLDIPTTIQPWEPDYALAVYTDDGVQFPMPDLGSEWRPLDPVGGAEVLDDDVDLAVRQLVEPWVTASNGRVETVCVVGDVAAAIGAFGLRRARTCELDPAEAIAWIAWAGASGGAHGRRRGAAAGRFGAWWLLAALGDLLDEWPVDPRELGDLARELRWFRWNAYEPDVGWTLQIAIEDPGENVAWAINASDAS